MQVQSTTTATGEHIKKAILTARFGEPLPQPWACVLQVNGTTVQGDELVFIRENLPSPAAAAPPLLDIQSCTLAAGGGGSGKVSVQDFHFRVHQAYGHGQGFAFAPDDSPGLLVTRGLPPDFDDGTTVFDPFGPQPMALGVIPTTNGVAINTKGTGAEKNRIIPVPVPPATTPSGTAEVPLLESRVLPTVNKHAVNTKGTGAQIARIVAPATPNPAAPTS